MTDTHDDLRGHDEERSAEAGFLTDQVAQTGSAAAMDKLSDFVASGNSGNVVRFVARKSSNLVLSDAGNIPLVASFSISGGAGGSGASGGQSGLSGVSGAAVEGPAEIGRAHV